MPAGTQQSNLRVKPEGKGSRVPRSVVLCEKLTELACELGPQARFPTVTQLREQWGGSLATLNTALNELEARNIIYRKHGVGIFVSPHLNQRKVWHHIALICAPTLLSAGQSPFWDLLVQRADERARTLGEDLSLHFALPGSQNRHGSAPFHSGLVHALENGQVNGVLAVGLKTDVVTWLEQRNVPLVGFACNANYRVEHDMPALVKLGTEALIARGCRDMALWSPVSPLQMRDEYYAQGALYFTQQYREIFRQILMEQNLPLGNEAIQQNLHLLNAGERQVLLSEREQGYETAMRALNARTRPDGLLITDDLMTPGVLAAVEKCGLQVGRDIQVATHANVHSPVLPTSESGLLRLEFDTHGAVDAMLGMLEALMQKKKTEPVVQLITPSLRAG